MSKKSTNKKSKKQQKAATDAPQNSAEQRSRAIRIIVIVLAVVTALSILLPSLSAIVSVFSDSSSTDTTLTSDDSSDDDEEEEETTVATIDAQYEDDEAELLASLEEDPTNLAVLLNLGELYVEWAQTASDYAESDEDTEHIYELYTSAITYYDQYLELYDSDYVVVQRAVALFERGDTQTAVDALLAHMEDAGASYPPLYVTLGNFYEELGETDLAISYYEQAVELDPDDAYGSLTEAEERLEELTESDEDEEDSDSTDEE